MAIDSANKRRSAQNLPWFIICPAPDGTVSTADRELVAGYYCGIPARPLTVLQTDDLDIVSLTRELDMISLTKSRDMVSITKRRDIIEV